MSLPSSLNDLNLLSRVDLQRLAKENGIAANSKNAAMIASLARRYGFDATKGKAIATSSSSKEIVAQAVSAERIVYATSPETQATVDTLLANVSALRTELTAAQLSIDELKAAAQVVPAERIVYATSPETQAIIDNLLVTVKDLRSELTAAQSSVDELKARSTELMRFSKSVEGLKTAATSIITAGPSQETSTATAAIRLGQRPVLRDFKHFDLTHAPGHIPVASTSSSTSAASVELPESSSIAVRKARSTELVRLSKSVEGLKTATSTITAGPSQETSTATATFRLPQQPVLRDLRHFDLTPGPGHIPVASTSSSTSAGKPASPPKRIGGHLGKHRISSDAGHSSGDIEMVIVNSPVRRGSAGPQISFAMSLRMVPDDDRHSRKKQKVSLREEEYSVDDKEQSDSHSDDADQEQDSSHKDSGNSTDAVLDYLLPLKTSAQPNPTLDSVYAAWKAEMAKLPKVHPVPYLPFPLVARPRQ
ncbi:hypothetical protein JCM21900_005208 [Sporobolomyces salmonicolor]